MKLSAVAPELRNRVRWMPPLPFGSAIGRRFARWLFALVKPPKVAGVETRAIGTLRVHLPPERRSGAALLWIHGGGYVIGNPVQDDLFCAQTARDLGIVVVACGYRLAPEHPFPAPLDDCHAAWRWLLGEAPALGIDPARIVIGGQSAGGGLAAGLVQRLHDEGARPLAQWLFEPMLDDRTAARRELDARRHFIWNNRLNRIGWAAFLGTEPGKPGVPHHAVPARRADLSGLPPAWIGVGAIDLFHDEDKAYAARLAEGGVDVTFHSVPGAPHGFESWGTGTRIAADFIAEARGWLAAKMG